MGAPNKKKTDFNDKPERKNDDIQPSADSHITFRIPKAYLFCAVWAILCGVAVIYFERHQIFKPSLVGVRIPSSSLDQSGEVTSSGSDTSEILNQSIEKQRRSDSERIQTMKNKASKEKRHLAFVEPEHHPDQSIRRLPDDLTDWPYGEMGIGVTLLPEIMSTKEAAKRTSMYKNHAFEEYVSELISLDRSLPDWRGDWCRSNYDLEANPDVAKELTDVSVIICFHNEAWSTLLRSVHSVINRTPPHLLREILLVDDASTMDHLGTPLDEYVKNNPIFNGKVKVLHQEKRQGLMRSRMAGIRAATADILVFLDSHIEAGIGWLEPLLFRILEDPKLIISPVIDAINDTTLNYRFITKDLYGLMNWRMDFEWYELSDDDRAKKPNIWAPHATPVMAGGLFAIRRDWFDTLGFYDEGMEIWGGENLELSFKAWMCGGRIEISPCSRVGHIFRTWSPYKIGSEEINHNTIRVAEVWMDEFKYLYYDRLGKFDEPMAQRLGNFGDISDRKKLREKLKCRSFKWFLDNVANGLPYHPLVGAGELRNPSSDLCIDKNDRTEHMDQPVDVVPCHGLASFQYWWMNKNRYLLRDYMCIGISAADHSTATVTHCGRAGSWIYDETSRRLRHSNFNAKCLTVTRVTAGPNVISRAKLASCDADNPDQEWTFTRFKKTGLKYTDLQ